MRGGEVCLGRKEHKHRPEKTAADPPPPGDSLAVSFYEMNRPGMESLLLQVKLILGLRRHSSSSSSSFLWRRWTETDLEEAAFSVSLSLLSLLAVMP